MSAPVRLDVSDGIGVVTLDRPATGNAVDLELVRSLGDVLRSADDDASVRVVLLRAAGKSFCVGGDLRAMNSAPDRAAFIHQLATEAHDAVRTWSAMSTPVVGAVQGSAAGAGLSFVLLCDIVVAAESASFVTAYTSVGLTPDCGQSWLLPRAVGVPRALELTLMPRRIYSEEASRLGFVHRIVAAENLVAESEAVAKELARGPAIALGHARRLVRAAEAEAFSTHLDLEAATITRAAATEEAGGAIKRFLM